MRLPVRSAIAIATLTVAACSGSRSQGGPEPTGAKLPDSISAEAMLSPSTKFASHPITLMIEGEYANFSKQCSHTKALIGVVGYPRQMVAFDEIGRKRIPSRIPGADESCPLHLNSVQVELRAGDGSPMARGAAHISAPDGRSQFQCYVSQMGPGTCLAVGPRSARAREANKPRLIGDLTIQWK